MKKVISGWTVGARTYMDNPSLHFDHGARETHVIMGRVEIIRPARFPREDASYKGAANIDS